MKFNRNYLFITVISFALLIVLIIQVNWILQTAKIKEEFFNEKANIVLARTTEALQADKETCKKIGDCVDYNNPAESSAKLGKQEVHKIDSLFTYYMRFYNFHIDYTFAVAKPLKENTDNLNGFANDVYYKPLNSVSNLNGVELKLIFPEKKQFIIAEMGTIFITSVILIIIVLILFWRTVLSLMKEKKIAEHTTEFLNNMTHEFKTPLTNIALAGKMIRKGVTQSDKIKQYSEIILEENEKLRLQVEHILSMTAFERGEIPLQKTEFDVHLVLQEALKSMYIQLESKHASIELKFEASEFLVTADKTFLNNALCNLLDNAIKYSSNNPEISIVTSNRNQQLIIAVSDKGIGIEKEFHQLVFDKFFRVPTGDLHNVKGFGIGLAYVKKIIELHNGTIELQSEKGKGTTFIIIIPYV